jgi:hypothetical protein
MQKFDSVLIEDIYDTVFKNTQYSLTDFVNEFKGSYIDNANACFYLCNEEGKELFKIKIEKV